jgi:hypothetical protein
VIVCIALVGRTSHAQGASSANPQEKLMHHYALLFRTTRAITAEEQKQRITDISAWIQRVTEMGVSLDPHTLEETIVAIPAEGTQTAGRPDSTLSNIVLFDAATREQAIEIARLHPAPRYGVSVELREWTAPRPLVARP